MRQEIQRFKDFLLVLAECGVRTSIFTWEPEGVLTTSYAELRGGATARAVDEAVLSALPCTRARCYTDEELWANMEVRPPPYGPLTCAAHRLASSHPVCSAQYFLAAMLPFCEARGLRLALHPNDPPIPMIAGVPCLIRNKEAYERVYAIAKQSPALGMEVRGRWASDRSWRSPSHSQRPHAVSSAAGAGLRARSGSVICWM